MPDVVGTFDVAIVGGGPGGSTLAALLARQGRSVCVVERDEFPRFRVGESLLPYSIDIFEKTGVLQKIHDAGFMVKKGARFVVDDTQQEECFWFRNGLDGGEHPYAFEVQRGPFDKLLLDHAVELGVKVLQPVAATDFKVHTDHAVLTTSAGEIHSQVVCDASGRWTFLSSKQKQRKTHPTHRKVSVFAHFRNVRRCEMDEGNVIIVRFGDSEKGWLWLIPFSDGTNSIGVVGDVNEFRNSGMTPEEFFHAKINASKAMGPRMMNAEQVGEIRSEADFSYTSTRYAGDRLVKIGDAGAFVDPVFSSGVFLATKAADMGADVLEQSFKTGDFSEQVFAEYEKNVRHGTLVFWAFIDAFYNRDFLEQMVTSRRRRLLQKSITSLLAGDVYNENNQLISYLTGQGGAYADAELQALFG